MAKPRDLAVPRQPARPAGQAVVFLEEHEQLRRHSGSSSNSAASQDSANDNEVEDWWEPFGDLLGGKEEGILRGGVQNFGGLASKSNQPEDESLRRWITEQHFDIYGIPETDLYWPKIQQKLQLQERVREWWETDTTHTVRAYNQNQQCTSKTQWGGTAQISRGQAAFRVMASGRDPTRLGRWVWTQYRGKGNRRLRVITAYRPCQKTASSPFATWTQQRTHFQSKNQDREPRKAIFDDLAGEINRWVADGEHVVLMMDCNEDVRSNTITTFLNECGMRDIVLERHGNEAPRTHKRGSHPIDAIFATHSVQCVRAGYAGFDGGVQAKRSDHRCLWFDVTINSIFGHEMPPTNKPQARRLKCNDPRVVKCFNQYYFEFLRKHKLHERAFALEAALCYPLRSRLQREAEKLVTKKMEGILWADKRCRKLRMGGIPYSKRF